MMRLPSRLSRYSLSRCCAGLLLAAGLGLFDGGSTLAQEVAPRFFEELDDLPLMAGLREIEEANVAFDKPGGRIGVAYAEGEVPAEEVRAFYRKALPQFGWERVEDNRFEREDEQLEIEVTEAAGTTTLRISIAPSE